jgi:hypothetical protein
MDTNEQEALFKRLLAKKADRGHLVYMRYYQDGNPTETDTLFNLLSLDKSMLTEDGKHILDYLENKKEESTSYFSYENFKWKLLAFLSLQDIFGMPMHTGSNQQNIFQLRYFYYESKYILIESILGSLNGLHIINKQALRNFLEFNLLQNYFFNVTEKAQSLRPFMDYLQSNISPSAATILKKAFPDDEFCKPIRKRIQVELNNLSNRYSHAYAPADSPKHYGIYSPDASFETLYFWIPMAAVLEIVLWTYYVNFPMLFFPTDILRKFGFNWPVGLFVNRSTGGIIKKAITEKDYPLFREYAGSKTDVSDLQHFYESQSDLSDDQIWETWHKERAERDTLQGCYAKALVEERATHEMLAVRTQKTEGEILKEFNEEEAMNEWITTYYTELAAWRKVYKKIK